LFSAFADMFTNRANSGCSLLFKAHLQLALFLDGGWLSGIWPYLYIWRFKPSGGTAFRCDDMSPPTKHAPDASKAVRGLASPTWLH